MLKFTILENVEIIDPKEDSCHILSGGQMQEGNNPIYQGKFAGRCSKDTNNRIVAQSPQRLEEL